MNERRGRGEIIAVFHVTHHEGCGAKLSWSPSVVEISSVDGNGREVGGLPYLNV